MADKDKAGEKKEEDKDKKDKKDKNEEEDKPNCCVACWYGYCACVVWTVKVIYHLLIIIKSAYITQF